VNIPLEATTPSGQTVIGYGNYTVQNLVVTDSAGNSTAIPNNDPGYATAQFPLMIGSAAQAASVCTLTPPAGGVSAPPTVVTETVLPTPETATSTATTTVSETGTVTATETATETATATSTVAPTITVTGTVTATVTATPVPTRPVVAPPVQPVPVVVTNTPTKTPTSTPTITPTSTATTTVEATTTATAIAGQPTAVPTLQPTQTPISAPGGQVPPTAVPAAPTATPITSLTVVVVHNAPRTVTGGRLASCDLLPNLKKLEPGCIVISSISGSRARVVYTLTYPGTNGPTQVFTDTADFRGHSLHIFNAVYLPPAGAAHGSPSTVVQVSVSATSQDGTTLQAGTTRFTVIR